MKPEMKRYVAKVPDGWAEALLDDAPAKILAMAIADGINAEEWEEHSEVRNGYLYVTFIRAKKETGNQ